MQPVELKKLSGEDKVEEGTRRGQCADYIQQADMVQKRGGQGAKLGRVK